MKDAIFGVLWCDLCPYSAYSRGAIKSHLRRRHDWKEEEEEEKEKKRKKKKKKTVRFDPLVAVFTMDVKKLRG